MLRLNLAAFRSVDTKIMRVPHVVWRQASVPFAEPTVQVEIGVPYTTDSSNGLTNTPVYYLHGIRNGVLKRMGPEYEARRFAEYERARPTIIGMIVDALRERAVAGAAGVCPPSSREDARPYLDGLIESGIVRTDASAHLARLDPGFRAGLATNLQKVRDSLVLVNASVLSEVSDLIIVDDVIASGRTAAAIALAFKDAGSLAASARIFIVAPLRVHPSMVAGAN